jgi:exopolysaccharide biosynthesis WecB/TagA/CpsF family protein
MDANAAARPEREPPCWPAKREILGVPVSLTGYDEAVRATLDAAREHHPGVVVPTSVHGLFEASRDPAFRAALASFELVTPDGQPVRWALNFVFGARLRERVYGPELMLRLCRAAASEGVPAYLYGSTPEVVSRLRRNLLVRFPGLHIVGEESPPFRPLTPDEDDAMVERIERSGAGLLFVGLGCPKQERFAAAHRDRIRAVQVCVGAAFDFLAGTKPMAPGWMQARGLEWLFRLATEPGRLWRRYLLAIPHFLWGIGRELASRPFRVRVPGARTHVSLRRGGSS